MPGIVPAHCRVQRGQEGVQAHQQGEVPAYDTWLCCLVCHRESCIIEEWLQPVTMSSGLQGYNQQQGGLDIMAVQGQRWRLETW